MGFRSLWTWCSTVLEFWNFFLGLFKTPDKTGKNACTPEIFWKTNHCIWLQIVDTISVAALLAKLLDVLLFLPRENFGLGNINSLPWRFCFKMLNPLIHTSIEFHILGKTTVSRKKKKITHTHTRTHTKQDTQILFVSTFYLKKSYWLSVNAICFFWYFNLFSGFYDFVCVWGGGLSWAFSDQPK